MEEDLKRRGVRQYQFQMQYKYLSACLLLWFINVMEDIFKPTAVKREIFTRLLLMKTSSARRADDGSM